MCHQEIGDIYCHTPGCKSILNYNAVIEDVRCVIAVDNDGEFGWCGRTGRRYTEPVRSDTHTCTDCYEAAVRAQNRIYQNLGQHVAQNRADQQKRDDDQRAREQGLRRAGDRSAIPPDEQAALVSGAGTEWSGGQGIHGQGASDMFAFLDEIPQDIELDVDETVGEGWNDPGEGSSRGYDERYTNGGGQRQNQQSGYY